MTMVSARSKSGCSERWRRLSILPKRARSPLSMGFLILFMPLKLLIHLARLLKKIHPILLVRLKVPRRKEKSSMAEITYRQALHDALRDELLRDENVFLMGEEIGVFEGSYKITAGLLKEFGPKRVVDTPICENGFVGMATGAAMLGLRPIVEIMTINFIILAMDEIVNHAAKIYYMFGGQCPIPLVIRTPGGGGQQLAATHSQNLEVWFAHIPGLEVVAPSTPADARGLLRTAVRDNNPVIFLENLALYNVKGEEPSSDYMVPIGQAKVIKEGTDLTVISYSRMAAVALDVARRMEQENTLSI